MNYFTGPTDECEYCGVAIGPDSSVKSIVAEDGPREGEEILFHSDCFGRPARETISEYFVG